MPRTALAVFTAAALLTALGASTPATAQHSTTLTYQGALQHQGEPYTGTADFAYRLWTAETGGAIGSSLVIRSGVDVDNGLFHVPLDFGAQALSGDRWAAISVRTPAWDGQGAEPPFTALPGRQRITASPYSIQTRGVFVNQAGDRVGIGTNAPLSTLHVAGEIRAEDGLRMPGGKLNNLLTLTGDANLGPLPSGASSGFIIPLSGALPGDNVLATIDPHPPEIEITTIRVTNVNQVFVRVRNVSGGTYDAPPMTLRVIVFKQ